MKKEELGHHPLHRLERTIGQKAADQLTRGIGNWFFITFFFVFILVWMAANVFAWVNNWDPYPFILLNLILSCVAAIQAPIILMSQNREAQKDRIRSQYDYLVNRKAEKEIQEIKSQLNRIEKKLR